MIREVLALAVVAKAAKISSMVDSCGSANRYDGVLVRSLGLVWLITSCFNEQFAEWE